MNRLRTYITSPLVSLSRFDHPNLDRHRDPQEEIAQAYSINFIEKGDFSLRVGKRKWQMSRTEVFVTYPGLAFQCHHSEELPEDVCFSVQFNSALKDDESLMPLKPDRLAYVVNLDNRLAHLHMCLSHLSAGSRDVLAAETLSVELLHTAFAEHTSSARTRTLYSKQQLVWYGERIEAVRRLIERNYGDNHSLYSLARFVGMSPFHFARIFRELTGTAPHQYLITIRLIHAAKLLLDGASVTETCFAAGFANLSHFIRIFQRKFGVSPSSYPSTRKGSPVHGV